MVRGAMRSKKTNARGVRLVPIAGDVMEQMLYFLIWERTRVASFFYKIPDRSLKC